MTYEKIQTGTFRVCIFLTVLFELLALMGASGHRTYIFGFRFSIGNAVIGGPVLIWVTYFFGLWTAKGFLGKK